MAKARERVLITLEDDTHSEIVKNAKRLGLTLSAYCRMIICGFLSDKKEKKERE